MGRRKRVGFAVVGLGHISERAVLPAFRHSQHAKLVAVVSGDAKKARRLAARFGARDHFTYGDYDLCLNRPEVEAVYIATHNGAHADLAIRAAAAGRHVLCEKPMAVTVEECRKMIAACRASDVRLMIAYRKYFEPSSRALKGLVARGQLGNLKAILSAFTVCLPRNARVPAWHFNRQQSGGGALMDLGVYCVNTARWLTGTEPIEASGYSWSGDLNRFKEVEENMAFRLTFPGGLVLQAMASFGAAKASFLHLHGETGWAALDPAFAYDQERRLFGKIRGRWFEKYFKVMDEFALELDAFARCIWHRKTPEPSGEAGLRDVAVMQAIYRSAREGHVVEIPKPDFF